MSVPPVISAPTLVTSTNPATTMASNDTHNEDSDFWHCKYLEAKINYKKLKSQMREQAKKSRILIVAVKNMLEQEEYKMTKLKEAHDIELSSLSQQLTSLQASMLREQLRVEKLLREKDQLISKKNSLDHLENCVKITPTPAPTSAVTGGSIRIHGSFRQYKKDREKSRQIHHKVISDTSSVSSGINVNSSEESSSSPSTLPRTQKPALRQTVSAEHQVHKTILKATSSVDNPGSTKTILDNLQQLIENNKTNVIKVNQDDSGRESDDIEQSSANVSLVTVVSTDSANSSFDASDPNVVKIIQTPIPPPKPGVKKAKPPPPPRSSQTKLSTVPNAAASIKPTKSILSPTSSLTMELSPTEALDNLIRNVDKLRHSEKKKRVKFNPKVDTDEAIKPLDEFSLPRLSIARDNNNILDQKNNFSYYEPYL